MLHCPGDRCPLRSECYRHTQPSPGRDRFASAPYDATAGTCAWFEPNQPSEALVREAAYYIWQRDGCPDNRAQEHWDEAYLSLCRSTGRIRSA